VSYRFDRHYDKARLLLKRRDVSYFAKQFTIFKPVGFWIIFPQKEDIPRLEIPVIPPDFERLELILDLIEEAFLSL
jgi:hypothetical protein